MTDPVARAQREAKESKRMKAFYRAMTLKLGRALEENNNVLMVSMGIYWREWETLIVIRGIQGDDRRVVAFMSADDAPGAVLKALAKCQRGELKFRKDDYAARGED